MRLDQICDIVQHKKGKDQINLFIKLKNFDILSLYYSSIDYGNFQIF